MTTLLLLFVLLDTAHVLAPLGLSLAHPGVRGLVLSFPVRFVVAPGLCFVVGCAAALAVLLGAEVVFPILAISYIAWNFWHFSMQNYGFLRLCGCRGGWWIKSLAFLGTGVGMMTVPLVVSLHHWLTSIGLSVRVMRTRWWLLLGALAFAVSPIAISPHGFFWLHPNGITTLNYTHVSASVLALIALRQSLGILHFALEGKLWKFSDPRVRAAIGGDFVLT